MRASVCVHICILTFYGKIETQGSFQLCVYIFMTIYDPKTLPPTVERSGVISGRWDFICLYIQVNHKSSLSLV